MATGRKEPVVTLVILAGLLWWRGISVLGIEGNGGRLLVVDYARLVARADLHYNKPVSRSEEEMPTGNGRMGSLVRTTVEAIRLVNPTYPWCREMPPGPSPPRWAVK